MKKFLKILSNIYLVINPVCLFLIVASIISGYWYYAPLFIIPIILSLKFYYYVLRGDIKEYYQWIRNVRKTHRYLGLTLDEGNELYKNESTGEIIEI